MIFGKTRASADKRMAELRQTEKRYEALLDLGKTYYIDGKNRFIINLQLGHEQQPSDTTLEMVEDAIDSYIDFQPEITPDGALDCRGQP